MRHRATCIVALTLITMILVGCAPRLQQSAQRSNLSAGTVKRDIVKGKTTQAEILELFGAPNLVTKNRDAHEVWNYNRMSASSVSGEDTGWAIFWGGTQAVSSTTTNSFDLILIFDDADVVLDYSLIQASY